MKSQLNILMLVGVMLSAMSTAALAQVTTIYQNDFESPSSVAPCTAWGNTGTNGTFASDYNSPPNFVFQQVGTADRVCIGGTSLITDAPAPNNLAGNYTGGFARNSPITESWSLLFDPDGRSYLNGSIDLSHVRPGNLTQYPGIGSANMVIRYYRVFADATTTTLNDGGDGLPAAFGSNGTAPVLLSTENITVNKASTAPNQLEWQTHTFAIDTSGFAPGDRVAMVATVVEHLRYIAFDNLLITAADAPAEIPQITKQFSSATISAGGTATLTINVSGSQLNDLPDLVITDNLPAPLQLSGTASTTCVGGVFSAPAGGSTISLSGATLPADGCQITATVIWPVADIASCTGSSVTNTITPPDGFSVQGGQNATAATASLTCNQAPEPSPATPVPGPGGLVLLMLAVGMGIAGGRRIGRAH